MKAAQLVAHGAPGTFAIRDLADLTPKDHEVILRVRACGLNRLDLWAEENALPIKLQLPRTLGSEISGEILSVGKDVTEWKTGDRVAVQSNLFCGECEYCARGRESLCLRGEILGMQRDGGFAEQVAVPESALIPLPAEISFETSAALTLAASTAMHMLNSRLKVRSGDWVLVIGGASGVGSAAIQIARGMGAYVIATASNESKQKLSHQLGAHHVVDSTKDSWPDDVRKITGKRGVDIVVEHVGGDVLVKAFSCLARGGSIVTCGATAGREVAVQLWPLFVKEQSLVGSYGRNRADIVETFAWVVRRKLHAVVDKTFPIEEMAEAFRQLRDRKVLGKVVIVNEP